MVQEEGSDPPTIGSEVKSFASQIDSLRQALPMTMLLLQAFAKDASKELKEFEERNCTVEVEETARRIQIPLDHYNKWNKLKHRFDQAHIARNLVPRSLFVSLVSQYDAFIGKLLRLLFLAKPELLNVSKRAIEFSELVTFPSIAHAREYVIGQEIETVLRMSHIEQFKWMENRFSISLTKFENWTKFVEITQRRNLFVHADGSVSKQYISVCTQSGFNLDDKIGEGISLGVPQKYFNEACTCILEVGVKLAQVLWRKLIPGQWESADKSLNELAFDLIDSREHELAISLLLFAVAEIKHHSNESRRLTFVVNLAQAYKWHGKPDECRRILDKEDWSAIGDEFNLAVAVLREDWERSAHLVEKIGKDGPIDKLEYRDWPVFKEFRERAEFLESYQKVFGEPFPISVQSESSDIDSQEDGVAQAVGTTQAADSKVDSPAEPLLLN